MTISIEILLLLVFLSSITAIVLAVLAFNRSVNAEIIVKAMEKSTHQIQYVPIETPDFKETDPFSSVDYSDYNTEYSKEIKKEMPFFASDEDDLKVRSI